MIAGSLHNIEQRNARDTGLFQGVDLVAALTLKPKIDCRMNDDGPETGDGEDHGRELSGTETWAWRLVTMGCHLGDLPGEIKDMTETTGVVVAYNYCTNLAPLTTSTSFTLARVPIHLLYKPKATHSCICGYAIILGHSSSSAEQAES